jgi:CheY-like chemotaxis protein
MNACTTGLAKPFRILQVDDDPDAAFLIQTALQRNNIPIQLHAVHNGNEALDFLRGKDRYAALPCPDLILLDLNMPGKDEREVLSEVKADPCLSHIPVIIMSTSDSEEDIRTSYRLHANSYVVKPASLSGLYETVEAIEKFWLNTARLPTRDGDESNNPRCLCDR